MDPAWIEHAAMIVVALVAVVGLVGCGAAEPESGRTANRLAAEKSPYLQQHAYNPVDWYPWGPEAFERARAENKPIFLSIGYSTCHWCHVMEKESFEDPEVAALMNETFVCIKVDREERPDIDGVYMDVAMLMTGRGGWPLTIIMTPDKRPFYAATYIPKTNRFGMPGMLDLVPRIDELWKTRKAELLATADQVTAALSAAPETAGGTDLGENVLRAAYDQLSGSFDSVNGGFGASPKFPTPHNLLFLLRVWAREGDERALKIVETTLRAMRRGGVYDHVGFGFHRYSTDARWLVPHFEKMLYDQAMLAMAYTETYQATGRPEYAETAREIFAYVLRDMTAPEGGFYSAEDADSEGEEGKFYLWTTDEVREVLGEDDAEFISNVFNLENGGNFIDEVKEQRTGANIPHLTASLDDIAESRGIGRGDLVSRIAAARERLFEVRENRVHPHKDDKILTDWNGLMIAALAKGASVLGDQEYADAARRSADFLLRTMRDDEARLVHRYRDGDAGIDASAEDYAFLTWGLLELYEATFDASYLAEAVSLNADLLERYWDDDGGALFFTADDAESLLTRRKEIYDGAIPSSNSVAMLNLLRLARITGDPELEERAATIGRTFADQVEKYPAGHTQLLSAVDFAVGPSREIAIVGEPGGRDTEALLSVLRARFVPNKVVLLKSPRAAPTLTELAPWIEHHTSVEGRATAYVCRDYVCQLPTDDPVRMMELITAP